MGVSAELTAKAQLAFDDELKLWTRHGTWRRGMTQLRRDETRATMAPIGPADFPVDAVIEHHEISDELVHDFLFVQAMTKALEAVQNDLVQAAVNAVALAEEAA
ncbi:hypothetical protein [Bradyrhizobium sp. HKCCYLS20291]|uniref:hypothetical protein n=1 Tax=Bradyrhizobium sp. HKCCYLS20291 TaxID=3420766 RepID=UPI003EB70C35